MCDVFLTLAKTKGNDSPSCFLVPRWCPDGSRNSGFKVMRLKDKLADRSNAPSEVEYDNAWGEMIGEEGRGVRTIIEMVQATRLDCAIGSASTAKRAVMEALNYTVRPAVFPYLTVNTAVTMI
jgi:putative acyl-CoA dehydrogenase